MYGFPINSSIFFSKYMNTLYNILQNEQRIWHLSLISLWFRLWNHLVIYLSLYIAGKCKPLILCSKSKFNFKICHFTFSDKFLFIILCHFSFSVKFLFIILHFRIWMRTCQWVKGKRSIFNQESKQKNWILNQWVKGNN